MVVRGIEMDVIWRLPPFLVVERSSPCVCFGERELLLLALQLPREDSPISLRKEQHLVGILLLEL